MRRFVKLSLLLAVAVVASVLLAGCFERSEAAPNLQAANACQSLCISQRNSGVDLSSGPCLSNNMSIGWVCDVAHIPRQAVDDEPTNQCEAYMDGTVSHFVEVDTDCNPIRIV